jgi:hypothetical protein
VEYADFSIKIEPMSGDAFPVFVNESPAGAARAFFRLPFSDAELKIILSNFIEQIRGFSPSYFFPNGYLPSPQEVGQKLFEALFNGPILSLFDRSLGMTQAQQNGLRIKLHIDPGEPSLALVSSLPWELLYRKETHEFLNLSQFTPILRDLDVQKGYLPLDLTPPLRVLVVLSAPKDYPLVDVEKEQEQIIESLGKPIGVQVDVLKHPTLPRLQECLSSQPYHVLHFTGHGGFRGKKGEGVLLFEKDNGDAEFVDGASLGVLFHDIPSLRLVVLNACETARMPIDPDLDPFNGTAAALLMAGIPSVLAMQFPITDRAALTFSKKLYSLLSQGQPIDQAVAEGRRTIRFEKTDSFEWATPVLFSSAPQGIIFQVAGQDHFMQDKQKKIQEGQAPKGAHIFLCYKSDHEPDQSLALSLQETLTKAGHHVFIDKTLRLGEAWLEKIDEEIKASDMLLVLISKKSADSQMVQSEVHRAYEYQRLNGKPRLLPVRVGFKGLLPYTLAAFLNPLQYITWDSSDDQDRVTTEVLQAIQGTLTDKKPVELVVEGGKENLSEDGRLVEDPEALNPPLPQFDPRFLEELEEPSGTVKLHDRLYIERDSDRILRRNVLSHGRTVCIRAPRQSGKSSLLVRGLQHARQNGVRGVLLDLQNMPHESLEDMDTFLRELAKKLLRELRMDPKLLEETWQGTPQDNLTYLMEDHILLNGDEQIILGLDEADRLINRPLGKDFFAMLRAWHNARAGSEVWNRLNLLTVISTEPYMLIQDVTQSPFNVGLQIELHDFTPDQVADLNQRHGGPVPARQVPELYGLLGGHPYLTRRALYVMVTEKMSWKEFANTATSDFGPFNDHLRYFHWRLKDDAALRQALRAVIRQDHCPDEFAIFRLLRAGLIVASGDTCRCRCDLYRDYFKDKV